MKQEEEVIKISEPVAKSISVTKRKLVGDTVIEEISIDILSDSMSEVMSVYKELKKE